MSKKRMNKGGKYMLFLAVLVVGGLLVAFLFNGGKPVMELEAYSLYFVGFLALGISLFGSVAFASPFAGWLIGMFSYLILLYIVVGVA